MLWIPFNAQIICAPVNNDKKLQLWPTWNEVGHSYNNQNKNKSKTKQGLFKRFCHHLLIKVDRNGQNIANLIPSQSTKFVSSYCCNRWFYHSKLTCMPKCCLLKSGSFMFLFLIYLNKKKRTWIINPPSKVGWMFFRCLSCLFSPETISHSLSIYYLKVQIYRILPEKYDPFCKPLASPYLYGTTRY